MRKKIFYNVAALVCICIMLCSGNALVAAACAVGMVTCLHKAGVINFWQELNSKY